MADFRCPWCALDIVDRNQRQFCAVCGASPAAELRTRRVTGLVFWFQIETASETLCRSCGRSRFRDIQNGTLLSGWWGVFAAPINLAVVAHNWMSARHHRRRLGPPESSRPGFPALPPGRPVFARPGFALTVGICLTLASVLLLESEPLPPTSPEEVVGRCVRFPSDAVVATTPCDQPNEGRVTAVVAKGDSCPLPVDLTLNFPERDSATVICIQRVSASGGR